MRAILNLEGTTECNTTFLQSFCFQGILGYSVHKAALCDIGNKEEGRWQSVSFVENLGQLVLGKNKKIIHTRKLKKDLLKEVLLIQKH